ncbi:MAG: cobalamin-binding protein [Mariprofundaceae bacterium]
MCRSARAGLLLLACWLAAAPAQAAERVLALAPHACEMMYALGAGDLLVGGVDYCDWPAAAKRLPRVGGYRRVDVEAALRLRPTLAVAMDGALPGLEKLRAFGVRVMVSNPQTLRGVLADMRRLADFVGRADAPVLARQARELARLEATRPMRPVRVFYEIWPDPLMTAGGRTFLNDAIRLAGGVNVFGDLPMEAPRVNVEAVVRARPEVIVVPLEKRTLAVRRAFWRRWLPGVRVIGVNPDLMNRPGPRLLDGVLRLRARLHAAVKRGQ